VLTERLGHLSWALPSWGQAFGPRKDERDERDEKTGVPFASFVLFRGVRGPNVLLFQRACQWQRR
jgi:hypothetical protein